MNFKDLLDNMYPDDAMSLLEDALEATHERLTDAEKALLYWKSEYGELRDENEALKDEFDDYRQEAADILLALRNENDDLHNALDEACTREGQLRAKLQGRNDAVVCDMAECMHGLLEYWDALPFGSEVDALLKQGKRVTAIKLVRARLDVGLRAAKNLIDARQRCLASTYDHIPF